MHETCQPTDFGLMAERRSSMVNEPVVSIVSLVLGGYEPASLDFTLRNVVAMTSTSPIIVHLSTMCFNVSDRVRLRAVAPMQRAPCRLPNHTTASIKARAAPFAQRVRINPQRLAVNKHSTQPRLVQQRRWTRL